MSVIRTDYPNGQYGGNNRRTNGNSNDEPSPYNGLWLNVGVYTNGEEEDPDGDSFIRLPRGIAIADLLDHKLYSSTDPDWAAKAEIINTVMAVLRKEAMALKEGESVPVHLHARLYRRQEEIGVRSANAPDEKALHAQIMGR